MCEFTLVACSVLTRVNSCAQPSSRLFQQLHKLLLLSQVCTALQHTWQQPARCAIMTGFASTRKEVLHSHSRVCQPCTAMTAVALSQPCVYISLKINFMSSNLSGSHCTDTFLSSGSKTRVSFLASGAHACAGLSRQGRAMYYGRAASADEYFSVLGFPLPYRINAADHILDLASGDISTPARHGPSATV